MFIAFVLNFRPQGMICNNLCFTLSGRKSYRMEGICIQFPKIPKFKFFQLTGDKIATFLYLVAGCLHREDLSGKE